jgi:hypothetical protein
MAPPTHLLRTTGEDPVARELLDAITTEWTPTYGPPVPGDRNSIFPGDLPHFVAIVEGGRPVAGGGLRPLGDAIAEVKRIYRSAGFAAIPDYNGNPYATQWAEKPL